jgi:polysaccharide biosynthesis transport protein
MDQLKINAAEEIDLRRLTGVLRRRWRFIAATSTLLFLLAMARVLTLQNWYTAQTVLVLDQLPPQLAGLEAAAPEAPVDPARVRSEVELLMDPGVGIDVIKKLDLMADPEFAPYALPPTAHWWSPSVLNAELAALAGLPDQEAAAEAAVDPVQRLVKELLKHATASNDGRSYVITLGFEWTDPNEATRIVNAWADAYLARQLNAKYVAAGKTEEWLRSRADELRKSVQESEHAVQEYRDTHQLLEVKGTTVTLQQLTELNTQLVLATNERSQKEAIYAQLQTQLKNGTNDSSSIVLASPLIQRLREQESDALRRLSDLTTSYGDEYPAVKRARSEVKEIRAKIQTEIAKVLAAAAADAAAARAREADLHKQIEAVRGRAVEADSAEVGLKELEREAQANRALLAQFMLQSKEASAQQGLERPSVRVVSPAVRPYLASFPNRSLLLAASCLAAVSLGAIGAFLREGLSRHFLEPADLRQAVDVQVLGFIPEVRLPPSVRMADYVVQWPNSELAEAVRSIRTRLTVALDAAGTNRALSAQRTGRVVVVTSALPEEGKTTTAVALARNVAMTGKRVLLVDADLRRPAVLRELAPSAESRAVAQPRDFTGTGFTDLVMVDRASGLHYMTAAVEDSQPDELLESHIMGRLLNEARAQYDLVVIDTPPVLVVSDAVLLARFSDGVLYVMRWETTPRAEVIGAIRVLREAGADLAGVVMSRVDTRRLLPDWVADTGLISGRYESYYHNPGRGRPFLPAPDRGDETTSPSAA